MRLFFIIFRRANDALNMDFSKSSPRRQILKNSLIANDSLHVRKYCNSTLRTARAQFARISSASSAVFRLSLIRRNYFFTTYIYVSRPFRFITYAM